MLTRRPLARTLSFLTATCMLFSPALSQEEPRREVHQLAFFCQDHFTGGGKGVCKQQLQVYPVNIPPQAQNLVAVCNGAWRYTSEGRPGTSVREVQSEARMAKEAARFWTAVVELKADLGSITAETKTAEPANWRCSGRWE